MFPLNTVIAWYKTYYEHTRVMIIKHLYYLPLGHNSNSLFHRIIVFFNPLFYPAFPTFFIFLFLEQCEPNRFYFGWRCCGRLVRYVSSHLHLGITALYLTLWNIIQVKPYEIQQGSVWLLTQSWATFGTWTNNVSFVLSRKRHTHCLVSHIFVFCIWEET